MTDKNWRIWVGGGLLLLLGLWLWTLRPGPTWWNFDRLRVGMTLEEAEALMGPPSEDKDAETIPIPSHLTWEEAAPFREFREVTSRVRIWHGTRYWYYTHFDKAGRLRKKYERDLIKEQSL